MSSIRSFPPLKIGELTARIPVIQGGMGVGISLSGLAGAVAAQGGVGIISTAQIGFREASFDQDPISTNLRVIGTEIQKARKLAAGGIIGVNIMTATRRYEDYVKAAVAAGVDLIISGAGLPMNLPRLVSGSRTKIAPIVSSLKSAQVILRYWQKKHERLPDLVVIDSIQTIYSPDITSSAGSVSQVKECSVRLMNLAKQNEIPTFIVGHVNKDGAIAGPKVMEHIVDTVLYFEGDKTLPYRVLRAAKNRYGSTNEIGMFDMTGNGLRVIENPSQILLEGRPVGVSGNCVSCTVEGSRPILSEVQALVSKTAFGTPRRAAAGFDFNRTNLLLAVLEKRAGYFLGNLDVYINIVGGLDLDDTACDLAVCLAVVSGMTDRPVPDDLIAVGEVGLGGEVRNVPNLEQRLKEAQRMGFVRAMIPAHGIKQLNTEDFPQMELIPIHDIRQAVTLL